MLEQSVAEKYKKESYSYNYGDADLLSIPKDVQSHPRNMQNRMVFSDVQDSVLNTRNISEYAYDAFGRRVETNQYLGDYTRNLYDGFTFDVIGKSVLQSAYSAASPDQKYRTPASSSRQPASSGRNTVGTEIGTRYRYIDDNPLVPIPEAGNSSITSTSTTKTRSRPNNEYVLYTYGEPVAISADGVPSYFGTDILGSVRSVTDKYGSVQSSYDYDVFGSPYLGNLENTIVFGYCGKTYDTGTELYDYGFRDYSSVSARFTTVDPIRDGTNWFSYVVNDPINYVDPLGLKANDSKVKPYFTNKTKDYYVVITEHPTEITPDKVDTIIIEPNGKYYAPIDGVENIRTGEVRKVATGSRLTAKQDKSGIIKYSVTPFMDILGTGASSLHNVSSWLKDEKSYRSNPGLYPLDKRPADIQNWFDDPNHQTLRDAEAKAKLLQEENK